MGQQMTLPPKPCPWRAHVSPYLPISPVAWRAGEGSYLPASPPYLPTSPHISAVAWRAGELIRPSSFCAYFNSWCASLRLGLGQPPPSSMLLESTLLWQVRLRLGQPLPLPRHRRAAAGCQAGPGPRRGAGGRRGDTPAGRLSGALLRVRMVAGGGGWGRSLGDAKGEPASQPPLLAQARLRLAKAAAAARAVLGPAEAARLLQQSVI